MSARVATPAEQMPRRARYLVPKGLPRRGEILAACVVVAVVGHLLFAQLTLVLAVVFALTTRATRWRLSWLLVPVVIGAAWTLAVGLRAAAAGFTDGPAKVVGYDVTGDIALIRLQNPSGLHQVPVGDSSTVKTGDAVTALGNAEGQSQIVSAAGQVTAVNQTITASDQGGTVKTETLHGMIQTNADIVSGDSGGPLADSAVQVIGMDTAGNDVSIPNSQDRKSTRLNSSHITRSRMPSSA